MADLTDPDDLPVAPKLPAQRRPSKPVKIPDEQRQRFIEELQRACGAGYINLDEFADRAGMVWAAATSMELDAIVADLPAPATETMPAPVMVGEAGKTRKVRQWIVAVMSGANPKGRWRVGKKLNVVCVMGGAEVDLREAAFDGDLDITVVCVMGGASILVPEGIDVELSSFPFMGGADMKLANVPVIPGSPTIRVKAVCIMGGMDVRSKKSAPELAALREQRKIEQKERRELRRIERDREGLARGRSGDIRREIRRTIHESILESVESGTRSPRRDPAITTTDDDAAAVRRRLKRNGRPEGTVTILFTDIEGSTEMIERLGDSEAALLVKEHNELVRAQVDAHGGFEVKFRGDGFMLAFTSAAKGLRCAIAIQQEMKVFAQRHPEAPCRVRVGINAGEAVPDGNDFLGTAVNIAARLTDSADGGDVMVTSIVRDLVLSSGEFTFFPEQTIALKGISDPQRACLVEW